MKRSQTRADSAALSAAKSASSSVALDASTVIATNSSDTKPTTLPAAAEPAANISAAPLSKTTPTCGPQSPTTSVRSETHNSSNNAADPHRFVAMKRQAGLLGADARQRNVTQPAAKVIAAAETSGSTATANSVPNDAGPTAPAAGHSVTFQKLTSESPPSTSSSADGSAAPKTKSALKPSGSGIGLKSNLKRPTAKNRREAPQTPAARKTPNKPPAAAKKVTATASNAAETAKSPAIAASVREDRLSKELKNLDIQIHGYSNSCRSAEASAAGTGDMMIKASISEIVKTKSRASVNQSMYKGAVNASSLPSTTAEANKQASSNSTVKPTETEKAPAPSTSFGDKDTTNGGESTKPTAPARKKPRASTPAAKSKASRAPAESGKNQAKPATSCKKPKNQNAQEQSRNKESKAKSVQVDADALAKATAKTNADKPIIAGISTAKPKAAPRKRAPRPRKPPAPRPTKAKCIQPIAATPPPTVKSVLDDAAITPAKETGSASDAILDLPSVSIATMLPAYLLTPKESFSYAHSPNFSDPDTVSSPMLPECGSGGGAGCTTDNEGTADAVKHAAAPAGESHIKKMVQDILEGLEMSDECSMAMDKPFTGTTEKVADFESDAVGVGADEKDEDGAAALKNDLFVMKLVKTECVSIKEKITVKSIESLTLPVAHKGAATASAFGIKVEPRDNETAPTATTNADVALLQKNIKKEPDADVAEKTATPAASNPIIAKAVADDAVNEAKDKDIYDFDESAHSSEDTTLTYIKASKKDENTAKTADKTVTSTAKEISTKKSSNNRATKRRPSINANDDDNDDDDTSTSEGDNNTAEKKRQPPTTSSRIRSASHKGKRAASTSSDTNSSSDSDDHSPASNGNKSRSDNSATSVRTRVNNRRKSASKKRRIRMTAAEAAGEGPAKRHRMASLNALAKVQCLYENESRTAQELGFVREPRIPPRVRSVTIPAAVVEGTAAAGASGSKEMASMADGSKTGIKSAAAATLSTLTAEKKVEQQSASTTAATAAATALSSGKDARLATKSSAICKKPTTADEHKTDVSNKRKAGQATSAESNRSTSSSSSSEDEKPEIKIDIDAPRALRTVPGLRGAGKLWEMGNMSSMESDSVSEDDESYEEVSDCCFSFYKYAGTFTRIKHFDRIKPTSRRPKRNRRPES